MKIALPQSTIYKSDLNSNDNDSNYNTMVIKMTGTNSDFYDVYCLENDIVKIDRQSHYACKNMNLFCDGTCFVDCNENTTNSTLELNYCPMVEGNNISLWKTDEPTNMPTSSPTTAAPKMAPVTITTIVTTTSMITNDNNENESDNADSNGPSDAISITLIICVASVIVAIVASIMVIFTNKAEMALQGEMNQHAS